MAEVKKKKIAIDTAVNPFGETKTKTAPDWFKARPDALKEVKELEFKRQIEVDPRKWKKKVIEDGVYAVARYELALFATQLSSIEKKTVIKAVPKPEQSKKKFTADKKKESDEVNKALDDAAGQVKALYKKMAKKINDKVSLALDEVENDKGDNSKALAAGKEALKRFDRLNTSGMFTGPIKTVLQGMSRLSAALSQNKDKDEAFKAALKVMRNAESDFESLGKVARNVVKYLLDAGEKMAKDTKADRALQSFGKRISGGEVKKHLTMLVDNVDAFEKDLDEIVLFVSRGEGDKALVDAKAKAFGEDNKGKEADTRKSVAVLKKVGKEFNTLEKNAKK